jgi:O6-methylguanine-DNA--protein-cysteine methyltransferase
LKGRDIVLVLSWILKELNSTKKVWKALLDIPYGKTRTYLEQSKR